ncbi:MAG: cytochrome ubiquinol oxidase subunit I [Candidatus Omnitrophica bacterium]|nr:cytochrome ubiquinol oxidase subunit I [Candidatus Omnitrophota bacterium]
MTDLLFARSQMAISLGFHIVFACIGMTMPFFMAIAHWKWLKTGDEVYLRLTKAWSKGVAILFATGAVSGTLLSFELGLLWPKFMEHAGPIFGMPFSLEGTAFFLEAIALGVYLYGWKKIPQYIHWAFGVLVGVSGILSGIFVVAANAWMNSPAGFDWVNGQAINIDPVKAMFNDAWFTQALHMTIAAFAATAFAVAGVHAYYLKKDPSSSIHKKALNIVIWFAVIAALLQPVSGDLSAKDIAKRQPAKLAAAEALFETQSRAPLLIGGIPNIKEKRVDYAIAIPGLLSFLAHGDFNKEVVGLDRIPIDEQPPIAVVHYAFQIMVGIGIFLLGIALYFLFRKFIIKKEPFTPRLLKLLVFAAPMGFIAVEAGWTVTEVGRQPWILYGILRTKDSLTPMPGLVFPFMLTTGVYIFLAIIVTWLMVRQFKSITRKV